MHAFFRNRAPGRTLAGLLLLVLSLIGMLYLCVNLAKDASLWILGRHTIAEVVELWAEQTSEDGARDVTFRYYLRYRFTTSDGQTISGISSVGPNEWVGLGRGVQPHTVEDLFGDDRGPTAPVYSEQEHIPEFGMGGVDENRRVDVVYFPPYPSHNRLYESRYIPLLACSYVPLFFLGLAGLVTGWRLTRQLSVPMRTRSLQDVLDTGMNEGTSS